MRSQRSGTCYAAVAFGYRLHRGARCGRGRESLHGRTAHSWDGGTARRLHDGITDKAFLRGYTPLVAVDHVRA